MIGALLASAAAAMIALAGDDTRRCDDGAGWCAELRSEDGSPLRLVAGGPLARHETALPELAGAGGFDSADYRIWPQRVALADGASLIGVIAEQRTMYSGGGASAARLTLYLMGADGGVRPVVTVPWEAHVLIRACFSERDFRQRAGACHDEYDLSASLALAGTGAMPDLDLRISATTYPGQVSRSRDSLAKPRLRRRDLVRTEDPACSGSWTLRYDPAQGTYLPDAPLPECGDYLAL